MLRPLRALLMAPFVALFGYAVHVDFPLCPTAASFDIPCPGCGLTRATLALLHGNVHEALHLHPLVWLLTPLFVVSFSVGLYHLIVDPKPQTPSRRAFWSKRIVTTVALGMFALTLSVWLLRFAGFFGGPVPVTSLHEWISQRAAR